MEKIKNYENAKGNLILKICNFQKSERELSDIPYFLMEDLAVYVAVCQWENYGEKEMPLLPGITVTNDMLSEWGVAAEQVFEDAKVSSDSKFPLEITNFSSLFGVGASSEDAQTDEDAKLWVCSTKYKYQGASVLAYPGFYESVRVVTGYDEFFVLPSSINELLVCPIVPKDMNVFDTLYQLEETVSEANIKVVPENEVLSSQVYYYGVDGFTFARKALGYDTVKEAVKQVFVDALNKEGYENISFREMHIPKLDGRSYNGLAIIVNQPSNNFAAPTIDLDLCVKVLSEHGEESPVYVLRDCIEGVVRQIKNVEVHGVMKFEDYERIRDNIYLRSCNLHESNAGLLETVPHIKIKDSFAVYPVYDVYIGDCEGVCVVSSKMVEAWGITEEQFFADVFASSERLSPILLEKIPNTANSEGLSGWICSSSGDSGAAVIAYPDFFERVKAGTGMDEFYIVPDNREYIYLVPMPSDDMSDRLNGALNMEFVLKHRNLHNEVRDVLSNSVLCCNKEGVFAIAKEAFAVA